MILGYIFFKIEDKLKQDYYSKYAKITFLFTSRIPVAIIYPFPFFKRKRLVKGYLIYLFNWALICLTVYFFLKFIEAL